MLVVLHTTHMVVALVVLRTSQEEHTEDTDNYIECTEQEEHTEDTVVDTVVVHTVEDNNQRLEAYRKDIDWAEQKESKSERYTSDSNIVVVVAAAAVEVIDDSNTSSLEHVDSDHFLESMHLLVVVLAAPEVLPSSKSSTSRLAFDSKMSEKKRGAPI